MKYIFIINPAAGKRKLQKSLLSQIQLLLSPDQYQIHYTACPGQWAAPGGPGCASRPEHLHLCLRRRRNLF